MRRAAEIGAVVAREGLEFGVLGREVAIGGQLLALKGLKGVYEEVFLPLYGEHQASNAVCALAAVEALTGGRRPARRRAGTAGVRAGVVAGADGDRAPRIPRWSSTRRTTRRGMQAIDRGACRSRSTSPRSSAWSR